MLRPSLSLSTYPFPLSLSFSLLCLARDQSRSAVDQWQEARTNWNTIHELWREFAADNGVAIATDGE